MNDTSNQPNLEGLMVILDNHLQHLRSIKETEEKWLERFYAIFGGSIAWLATEPIFLKRITDPLQAVIFLAPFVFAAFFLQHVMAKERLSYYRVMRSVVRAQRILGLFESKFLSPAMESAPFPLGLGPHPQKDGTQPFSSFTIRQVAIVGLLVTFMELAYLRIQPLSQVLVWSCLILNITWLFYLYIKDDVILYNSVLKEHELAGFDKKWLLHAAVDKVEKPVELTKTAALKRIHARWLAR